MGEGARADGAHGRRALAGAARSGCRRLYRAAYDPRHRGARAHRAHARARLRAAAARPRCAARVIEEWELGGRASMQHDLTVHPDGRIYSVDMTQDQLYRLDPRVPGGAREAWDIPRGDLPLGGVFATRRAAPAARPRTRTSGRTRSRSRPTARSGSRSRSATSSRASIPRASSFDDLPARGRLLSAHAALRCARAHLVHDRGLEPPRHVRPGDAARAASCGCRRATSARRWRCARCRRCSGSAATSTCAAPPPRRRRVHAAGALRHRRRARRLGLVQPAQRAPHRPRRSRDLRDRDDRHALRGAAPAALRRAGRALDPGLLVERCWRASTRRRGSSAPGSCRSSRAAARRPTRSTWTAAADEVWICGTNSDSLIRFEPAQRALHGVSAADAGHLHARDRLRRRGPRLDLELERADLADRGRLPARDPARPARPPRRPQWQRQRSSDEAAPARAHRARRLGDRPRHDDLRLDGRRGGEPRASSTAPSTPASTSSTPRRSTRCRPTRSGWGAPRRSSASGWRAARATR